jgi:hypothetical protein
MKMVVLSNEKGDLSRGKERVTAGIVFSGQLSALSRGGPCADGECRRGTSGYSSRPESRMGTSAASAIDLRRRRVDISRGKVVPRGRTNHFELLADASARFTAVRQVEGLA